MLMTQELQMHATGIILIIEIKIKDFQNRGFEKCEPFENHTDV